MDLIRAAEAAEIIGVSRYTVWRWTRDGKLKSHARIGSEHLYDRSYVQAVAPQLAPKARKAA